MYAAFTGQPLEKVQEYTERDRFLSASEVYCNFYLFILVCDINANFLVNFENTSGFVHRSHPIWILAYRFESFFFSFCIL